MGTLSEQNRVPDGAPSRSVNARTKCELRAGAYLFGCVRSDGPLDVADIPGHWPRIIGVDFGYTHPFAAAELCWDRDSDCVYVTKTHRVSEQSPIYHAAALRAWGAREIPVAWPRDGRRQTLEGAGIPLAEQIVIRA